MRNIILRFTIALLSFNIGITSTMLTTPLRLLGINHEVTGQPPDIGLERANVRFTSIFGGIRGARIAETVEKLREIKTEQFDNNIPPPAKSLLTRLKHQLRDFVAEIINSEGMRGETPKYLRAVVLAQLEDAGVIVRKWEDVAYSTNYFQEPYAYGDIFEIKVEQPADHPELLVVTTTLGICCGEDTSLYIFRNTDGRWKLILAEESNDYDDVSGAQGRFQYAISSTDEKHEFFVVTANVTPWCTSNWQSIRYKVLRPGADAYQPRIILSNKDTIYLGSDPPYRLKIKGDGFSLTFDSDEFMERLNNGEESSLKTTTHSHVVKYKISGDLATRVSKAEATEKEASDQPR